MQVNFHPSSSAAEVKNVLTPIGLQPCASQLRPCASQPPNPFSGKLFLVPRIFMHTNRVPPMQTTKKDMALKFGTKLSIGICGYVQRICGYVDMWICAEEFGRDFVDATRFSISVSEK